MKFTRLKNGSYAVNALTVVFQPWVAFITKTYRNEKKCLTFSYFRIEQFLLKLTFQFSAGFFDLCFFHNLKGTAQNSLALTAYVLCALWDTKSQGSAGAVTRYQKNFNFFVTDDNRGM